jgi:hypothetical protein
MVKKYYFKENELWRKKISPKKRLATYMAMKKELMRRHRSKCSLNSNNLYLCHCLEEVEDIYFCEDFYLQNYPEIWEQKPENVIRRGNIAWFDGGVYEPRLRILNNAITKVKTFVSKAQGGTKL